MWNVMRQRQNMTRLMHVNLLYNEWQQERGRYFCVYCFKPMFLDVLVERLKGIAESIIADISRMKEDKP